LRPTPIGRPLFPIIDDWGSEGRVKDLFIDMEVDEYL